MKYRELVQFEPIETVIQLREADSHSKARKLVETFVISERMAEQLAAVVFPNLQFDEPADNKGTLVVGNYGTGKSHLMSLISALAEHTDVADLLKNKQVAKSSKRITGKFKVVRTEIGSTTMSLRDIICEELEAHLAKMGVSFEFPPAHKVRNNKDALTEMMDAFGRKHPDHGLLLAVDELLDYLKSRNEQAIILDLNFLRELGEVCSLVRFRVIAGLQESLFDSPRFQFVADSIRRVKDRFEQLLIARQDVAYVVSERLLAKNEKQKAWIRQHLQKFTPLYETMAERLEEFVRLFPVHPTYLEVFEHVSVAEKREVLKTLSLEMKRRLDKAVPDDESGLIGYDSYWDQLRENPALRSMTDVREVIDKSKVLEDRVQQAFTRPAYKPVALRIVHALSVHRLTTDDIYAKLGPTAEELRDGLCLYLPLPERTSDFLRTTVETVLREIIKTMSGQYISRNEENDQYYLDLKKDIDYDANIDQRADGLSNSQLDRHYFEALTRVMECADQTYVSGYRIWEHELEWREHKVTRRGYLFLGAPNERSTAQPPRDFYVYFIQPFEPPPYDDERLPDEVFFSLKNPDAEFQKALRLYAGAREMAASASSGTRQVYETKAGEHLKVLTAWLRQHMTTAYEVTHQGVPKKMVECLKGHRTGGAPVRDLVNLVGSTCLGPCFEDRYPDYPSFSVTLTTSNLGQAVEDCLRWLSGGLKTNLSTAILDGLELLDAEKVRPNKSRYARAVLEKLNEKKAGQVVNRKELITEQNGVESECQYKLEPELLVIVLLGLVHSGDISLSVVGKKIDAANLAESARLPTEQLCGFKHIERPKDLPLAPLEALFELLELKEGLIRNPETRDQAVIELHARVTELTRRVVLAKEHVQSGLPCWGCDLLKAEDQEQDRRQLEQFQSFLERLQAFNSPGKLKNFSNSVDDVKAQNGNLSLVGQVEELHSLVQELTPITSHLSTAVAVLPLQDPWCAKVEETRTEWRTQLLEPATRKAPDFRQKILRALGKVKDEYKSHYFKLHKKARLDINEDEKARGFLKDARLERLNKLTGVSLLPHASLTDLQNRLSNLKPCFALVKDDLDATPICPHCNFRPTEDTSAVSASATLNQIDEEIDQLAERWTKTLLENLDDPTAKQSLDLLAPEQKRAVNSFLKAKELPDKINNHLVQGIQSALSGLTPISVTAGSLLDALGEDSSPCTVEQFRERFDGFVQKITRGKDVSKLRIVVQKDKGKPTT